MSEAPAGWYAHPHVAGMELFWDGSAWTSQERPASVATIAAKDAPMLGVPQQPSRPRGAWLAATLIPILAVVAVGVVLILSHTTNVQDTVSNALSATLAKHSAEVTLSGSANIEGIEAPISGNGQFSFDNNTGKLQLRLSAVGEHLNEKAIYFGPSIYLNLGPGISKILPGKNWISLNQAQTSSSSGSASKLGTGALNTNNPGSILGVLGEHGNTIAALGPSTIHGVAVQGYSIKVNPSVLKAQLRRLPEWMRQAAAQIGTEKASYDVYISGSGTIYRLTTKQTLTVSGAHLNEVNSLDFHHFGIPVTVSPPPSSQVGSYEAFLKAAAALGESQVN